MSQRLVLLVDDDQDLLISLSACSGNAATRWPWLRMQWPA